MLTLDFRFYEGHYKLNQIHPSINFTATKCYLLYPLCCGQTKLGVLSCISSPRVFSIVLTPGEVAGIVVGAVAFFLILVLIPVLICCCCCCGFCACLKGYKKI